jgi:hypothetical protein
MWPVIVAGPELRARYFGFRARHFGLRARHYGLRARHYGSGSAVLAGPDLRARHFGSGSATLAGPNPRARHRQLTFGCAAVSAATFLVEAAQL